MSKKTKIAGITLVAALATPSYLLADHHRDGQRGHERFMDRIEMWDGNGDGDVTQAEVDAFRAERLAAFDADGDGTLSLQEYEALWLDAMRERMVDMFQRHDDDGDGQVTGAEFGEDFSRLVERMDRNDDGVLNAEDGRRRGKEARNGRGGESASGD